MSEIERYLYRDAEQHIDLICEMRVRARRLEQRLAAAHRLIGTGQQEHASWCSTFCVSQSTECECGLLQAQREFNRIEAGMGPPPEEEARRG